MAPTLAPTHAPSHAPNPTPYPQPRAGTPILDVKPFLPFADTARGEEVRIAPWLQQMPTPDLQVELSEVAAAQLRDLLPAMRLLKDEAQARRATHLLACLLACSLSCCPYS